MSVYLRSLLNKYKKHEIVNEVAQLDCVVERDLSLKSCFKGVRSKPEIINAVVRKLEALQREDEDIIRDVSAEMDLILHMRSSRKLWTLYEFDYSDGCEALKEAVDSDALLRTLCKKLGSGFKTHCIYKLEDAAIWLRIALRDRSYRPEKKSTMYAVHRLVSSFIVTTNIVAYMRNAVFSVLSSVFKFANAKETNLTGKCARSLIQIVHDKENHGIHTTNEEQSTLVKTKSTKRKAPEVIEVPHLANLQQAEKRQRRNYMDSTFGTEEQPLLQTLTYTLETNFCGNRKVSEDEQHKMPFHCRVVFSGPSVLEGLREMVDAGVATYPLAKTLRSVKSLKRNKWRITNSRR